MTPRELRSLFLTIFIAVAAITGGIETSKWLTKRRKTIGPPTIADLFLAFFGIDSGRIRRK